MTRDEEKLTLMRVCVIAAICFAAGFVVGAILTM